MLKNVCVGKGGGLLDIETVAEVQLEGSVAPQRQAASVKHGGCGRRGSERRNDTVVRAF